MSWKDPLSTVQQYMKRSSHWSHFVWIPTEMTRLCPQKIAKQRLMWLHLYCLHFISTCYFIKKKWLVIVNLKTKMLKIFHSTCKICMWKSFILNSRSNDYFTFEIYQTINITALLFASTAQKWSQNILIIIWWQAAIEVINPYLSM